MQSATEQVIQEKKTDEMQSVNWKQREETSYERKRHEYNNRSIENNIKKKEG